VDQVRLASEVGARSAFHSGLAETSSVNSTKSLFGLLPAVVVLSVGAANLRVHDDVTAPDAAEILDRRVAALLHELLHAVNQVLDHRRPNGAIEHRRGADLHGAAAQQHVVERVGEGADAADTGERLVGKRVGEL
jgi:predicted subunit of tRNA(5-methylaminomethyl-2-thiouridylate) methyltransferase